MESVYELFKKVREHPDYVFGTVFTVDDFSDREEAKAMKTDAKHAEQALTSAGFEWMENS